MADLSVVYRIAADISGLQKGVAQAAQSTQKLEQMASRLGESLAKAFTIGAMVAVGKQFVDLGSKLTDLSQKTGISTDGLQKLQLAFEQEGVSIDTVTTSVTKLARNLLEGDKSTVAAMTKLGLSMVDLKQMAPEKQFLAVADAIGNIQNPTEKAWAAIQIFGKGGAELLAGLTGHLTETTDEFERMGLIIDKETIKAADDFGDKLGLLGRQLMGVVATIVGPLLPALSMVLQVFANLGKTIGSVVGPVLTFAVKAFLQMTIAVDNFLIGILESAQKIPLLGKVMGVTAGAIGFLKKDADLASKALAGMNAATTKTSEAATKAIPPILGLGKADESAAKEKAKLIEKIRELEIVIPGLSGPITALTQDVKKDVDAFIAFRKQLDEVQRETWSSIFGFKGLADGLENLGEKIDPVSDDLREHLEAITRMEQGYDLVGPTIEQARGHLQTFGAFLKNDLGKIILQAFQGGGDIAKSIGAAIGGWFTSAQSTVGKALSDLFSENGPIASGLGKIFGKGFGNALGGILGSIIPGLGTLLGGLLGKAAKGLGKLFGIDKEWEHVNDLRDAFQAMNFGSLEAMDAAFRKVGLTVDRVLNAKKVEDFQSAIDEFNKAVEFQNDSFEFLNQTVEKYGFTIEELGPAFQRQKLDEQAQLLFKEWSALNAAGIDTTAITTRMSENILEFFHNALKTGQEIPIAMKPMLQQMVDMGLLTDANGNKITNLEEAGVSFSLTMSEGFKSLIDEVKKLTDAIARGLGLAIQNVPDVEVGVHYNVDNPPPLPQLPPGPVTVPPPGWFPPEVPTGGGYSPFGALGGLVTARGIQHFAMGGMVQGRGTDTVPAWLTPGEMVLPKDEWKDLATQQAVDVHAHLYLEGREVTNIVLRDVLGDKRGVKTILRRVLAEA